MERGCSSSEAISFKKCVNQEQVPTPPQPVVNRAGILDSQSSWHALNRIRIAGRMQAINALN
jgi:hypothetical protein